MLLPAKAAIRGCVAYATQPRRKTDLAPFHDEARSVNKRICLPAKPNLV